MTTIRELEATVRKLEKKVAEINQTLGILPPVAKPLGWNGFTERDRKVLEFLILQDEDKEFTTTQIAEAIRERDPKALGRVNVYNSLKRIQRVARKKRKKILDHDRRRKSWKMNRADFMFRLDRAVGD